MRRLFACDQRIGGSPKTTCFGTTVEAHPSILPLAPLHLTAAMASLAARFAVPVAVTTPKVRRATRHSNTRVVLAVASDTTGEDTKKDESPEDRAASAQAWIDNASKSNEQAVDAMETSSMDTKATAASDFAAAVEAAKMSAPTKDPPPVFEQQEFDPDVQERSSLTRKLLSLAAASSRGQQTNRDTSELIGDILVELEFLNPTDSPAKKVDGEWTLVYANVEAFRSSPFFWGFQKIVPGGEEMANQLFKFTAGLPVAGTRGPFGQINQTLSIETEELVSEVEMKIFDPFFGIGSGIAGTVVSTANVKVCSESDGDVLLVTPRTTRVRNSNVGGALLDQLVVPTSDLMSSVMGGGAVEAKATVTYLDDSIRITRVGENLDQVFVYTRAN